MCGDKGGLVSEARVGPARVGGWAQDTESECSGRRRPHEYRPAWTKNSEAWHFRVLQSRFPSNEPHRDTARTRGQDPGVQTGPFLARRVPAHGRGVRQYVGRHHTHRYRGPVQEHSRRDRAAGSGRTYGESDQRLDQAAAAAGPGDSELPSPTPGSRPAVSKGRTRRPSSTTPNSICPWCRLSKRRSRSWRSTRRACFLR